MSALMTSPLTRPVWVPCVCAEVASRSQTLAVQSADPVTANLHDGTHLAVSYFSHPPIYQAFPNTPRRWSILKADNPYACSTIADSTGMDS